jgi:hypothetical protein
MKIVIVKIIIIIIIIPTVSYPLLRVYYLKHNNLLEIRGQTRRQAL